MKIENPDQLIEELKKAGIDPNRWVDREDNYVKPMALDEQRKLLTQMRDLLEGIVDQDRKKVLALKEQVARLKHGGGV